MQSEVKKTELCFANAAICYSAQVTTLNPVQLQCTMLLNMPGSLHWTIRLTDFCWMDGANHQNNVFRLLKYICCFSGSALCLTGFIIFKVKGTQLLWAFGSPESGPQIAEEYFQRGFWNRERCWLLTSSKCRASSRKIRKAVRLLKKEQRITRISLFQDNTYNSSDEDGCIFGHA